MKTNERFASIFASAALLLTLSACTKSGGGHSYISDPFADNSENSSGQVGQETGDIPENIPAAANDVGLLSTGGYNVEINRREPLVYDGSPIKIPVEVSAGEENKADMSYGISANINGIPQKLTLNGEESYVAIIKDIKAGETVAAELTLDPVILDEDSGRDTLPLTFYGHFNPHYKPTEDYPTFGNTHSCNPSFAATISMDAPAKTISPTFSEDFTEELATKAKAEEYGLDKSDEIERKTFVYLGQESFSDTVFRTNAQGTLELNAIAKFSKAGTYFLSAYVNDELVQVNGKDFLKAEVKEGYIYSTKFTVAAKAGDYVELRPQKRNSDENDLLVGYKNIHLVVGEAYQPPQNDAPSAPDNSESEQSAPQDGSLTLNDISLNAVLGYDGENILITDGEKLYLANVDENRLLSELDFKEYSVNDNDETYFDEYRDELPQEYSEYGWGEPQVLDSHIVFIKNDYSDGDYAGSSAVFFDKELKKSREIPTSGYPVYFTSDGLQMLEITLEEVNGEYVGSFYLSNADGSDRKKLYAFPEADIYAENCVYSEGVFYLTAADDRGGKTAVVLPVDGNAELYKSVYLPNDTNIKLIARGSTVFWQAESDENEGFLIYDAKDGEFREIKPNHRCDGELAALSCDGTKIVCAVTEYSGTRKSGNRGEILGNYIRVYDAESGGLLTELDISGDVPRILRSALGRDRIAVVTEAGIKPYELR